ncbi:hypothetical protein A9K97_gp305 [Tokyovirus A1]|uniref:hypothetical protein n=1 Tax=Tokyovirus A1 TaxID=1826170 RepID=UPI0007A98B1B|nr:hypothetical protein A9K97_gp305 [Tokyovirus A1]BAU80046.1 hypothetical protein [Tokyovirus A1]
MQKFFEKRELVCIALVDTSLPSPERKDFMTKKITKKGFREVRGVLPNGETFYYIAKFSGGVSLYATYIDGKMEGLFRVLLDKELLVEGQFKEGKPHGVFYEWCGNSVASVSTFVDGKILEWACDDEVYVISRNENKGTLFALGKQESENGGLFRFSWLFSGKEDGEPNIENIGSSLHIALPREKFRHLECSEIEFFSDEREGRKSSPQWHSLTTNFLWVGRPTTYEERCP